MKKIAAAFTVIALIGLALPSLASADIFTFVCDPSTEPAPAGWFGGPWTTPVRVVVDTQAKTVELFDSNSRMLSGTENPARLASLNNYQMDLTVTESTISWGVPEMWGFSGYIDRKNGRLDVLWTNPAGYSPNTVNRQFHGTCRQR